MVNGMKLNKKRIINILVFLSFIIYAFNVLKETTGHLLIPPLTESYWSWKYNIQLIPFFFVGDLINQYNSSGFNWFFWNAVKLSFYNILLLLPLGVYLSMYKVSSIKRATFIIFLVSFAIESMQVLLSYFGYIFPRSFNVDDLILNTLGGIVGYVTFEQMKKFFYKIRGREG